MSTHTLMPLMMPRSSVPKIARARKGPMRAPSPRAAYRMPIPRSPALNTSRPNTASIRITPVPTPNIVFEMSRAAIRRFCPANCRTSLKAWTRPPVAAALVRPVVVSRLLERPSDADDEEAAQREAGRVQGECGVTAQGHGDQAAECRAQREDHAPRRAEEDVCLAKAPQARRCSAARRICRLEERGSERHQRDRHEADPESVGRLHQEQRQGHRYAEEVGTDHQEPAVEAVRHHARDGRCQGEAAGLQNDDERRCRRRICEVEYQPEERDGREPIAREADQLGRVEAPEGRVLPEQPEIGGQPSKHGRDRLGQCGCGPSGLQQSLRCLLSSNSSALPGPSPGCSSCSRRSAPGSLIDCGMFQGAPGDRMRNFVPFSFDPSSLDALLLTHAHLDHCGLIPRLVISGFGGPIYATSGTAELAAFVLLDSGRLQQEFAKREMRWERAPSRRGRGGRRRRAVAVRIGAATRDRQ